MNKNVKIATDDLAHCFVTDILATPRFIDVQNIKEKLSASLRICLPDLINKFCSDLLLEQTKLIRELNAAKNKKQKAQIYQKLEMLNVEIEKAKQAEAEFKLNALEGWVVETFGVETLQSFKSYLRENKQVLA